MSQEDNQEWAEYQGVLTQGTLKITKPELGAMVSDTTTRADYKVTNGVTERKFACVLVAISTKKVCITIREISMLW